MPKFLITVASPVFPHMKFLYRGKIEKQQETPHFDFPSCHLHGLKDQVCGAYLNIDKLFKKPYNSTDLTVIPYDEAHKFPRSLEDKHFEMLKEFIKN